MSYRGSQLRLTYGIIVEISTKRIGLLSNWIPSLIYFCPLSFIYLFFSVYLLNHFFPSSVVPVIREVPKVVTISKKKTVVIECKVMSMYEPSVTWMKEKNTVKEDNKHVVHIEQVKDVSMNFELWLGTVEKRGPSIKIIYYIAPFYKWYLVPPPLKKERLGNKEGNEKRRYFIYSLSPFYKWYWHLEQVTQF